MNHKNQKTLPRKIATFFANAVGGVSLLATSAIAGEVIADRKGNVGINSGNAKDIMLVQHSSNDVKNDNLLYQENNPEFSKYPHLKNLVTLCEKQHFNENGSDIFWSTIKETRTLSARMSAMLVNDVKRVAKNRANDILQKYLNGSFAPLTLDENAQSNPSDLEALERKIASSSLPLKVNAALKEDKAALRELFPDATLNQPDGSYVKEEAIEIRGINKPGFIEDGSIAIRTKRERNVRPIPRQ